MAFLPPQQFSEETERRGLRKTLFVTALDTEMDVVRAPLGHHRRL